MHVTFDDAAEVDIDQAFEWYRKRSLFAPERFLSEIRDVAKRIAQNPLQFPISHFGCRAAQLEDFPHLLHFRIHGENIIIVAVAHPKRHPNYFEGRLRTSERL